MAIRMPYTSSIAYLEREREREGENGIRYRNLGFQKNQKHGERERERRETITRRVDLRFFEDEANFFHYNFPFSMYRISFLIPNFTEFNVFRPTPAVKSDVKYNNKGQFTFLILELLPGFHFHRLYFSFTILNLIIYISVHKSGNPHPHHSWNQELPNARQIDLNTPLFLNKLILFFVVI